MGQRRCRVAGCGESVCGNNTLCAHHKYLHEIGVEIGVTFRRYRTYMKNTPAYRTWLQMKARCSRESHEAYRRYGARGITFDPRWSDFMAFYKDMGQRPFGYHLHRIDPGGPYCRSNCIWMEPKAHRSVHTMLRRMANV